MEELKIKVHKIEVYGILAVANPDNAKIHHELGKIYLSMNNKKAVDLAESSKDVSEVETTLNQLKDLNGKALVKKLEREPGKRDSRYVHLLSNTSELDLMTVITVKTGDASPDSKSSLEQRFVTLEKQVAELSEQVSHFTDLLKKK